MAVGGARDSSSERASAFAAMSNSTTGPPRSRSARRGGGRVARRAGAWTGKCASPSAVKRICPPPNPDGVRCGPRQSAHGGGKSTGYGNKAAGRSADSSAARVVGSGVRARRVRDAQASHAEPKTLIHKDGELPIAVFEDMLELYARLKDAILRRGGFQDLMGAGHSPPRIKGNCWRSSRKQGRPGAEKVLAYMEAGA